MHNQAPIHPVGTHPVHFVTLSGERKQASRLESAFDINIWVQSISM